MSERNVECVAAERCGEGSAGKAVGSEGGAGQFSTGGRRGPCRAGKGTANSEKAGKSLKDAERGTWEGFLRSFTKKRLYGQTPY